MNKQTRYELILTVEEDLHSGTGAGNTQVDAEQILNYAGIPVLRATNIKGALREAAEQLLKLDQALTKDNVNKLFGLENPQRVSPKSQRSALLMVSPKLTNKLTDQTWRLTWTSSARELDNRVPKPNSLRSEEYVAAGAMFKGELALENPQLLPLLKRCLKRMTHIGSQRSRDAGRVRVEFNPIRVDKRSTVHEPAISQYRCLRLLLRNLEPILLPVIGHRGNLLPTACYIRGQQLLGAFFNWAITAGQLEVALPILKQLDSMGNAYPLPLSSIDLKKEGDLPIHQWSVQAFPLPIYTPKPTSSKQTIGPWWLSAIDEQSQVLGSKNEIDKFRNSLEPEEKPKRPGDHEFLFRANQSEPWQRYSPIIQINLRHRPVGEKLFSEEEIAEDTLFLADLMFPDHQVAQQFREVFLPVLQGEEWLAIGRGGRPLQVEQAQWLSPKRPNRKSVDSFTLTLNSDLIARAPNLNFYDRLDPDMLAELADLESFSIEGIDWRTFSETLEVRGFNARSGLPRVPALAIRRGSSICIAGPHANRLYQRLAQLPALGERQWEGFGRFELDFSPLEKEAAPTQAKVKLKSKHNHKKEAHSDSLIGQRESLLAKAFKLAEKIPKPKSGGEGGPTKTQWQYLRQQVNIAKGQTANDKSQILRSLDTLQANSKKLGGQPWKRACLPEIKRIVENDCQSLEEAQFFINGLVRQQWLKLKDV